MNGSKKKHRKQDIKSRIIERQTNEIDSLKKQIYDLEIDCDKKDELINSIDSLRVEFDEAIQNIRSKGEAYDALIEELNEMKKIMNEEVFRGKWNIIRLLMR